ncbi:hypothetical protein ACFYO2_15735 [Streptomyces sp. NPDC006602]|uniref:hypothetical protein n=1 Tax=Streptomyces sp. NPDC006602 TaxID=3364751 RepID=UPI00367FF915
MTPPPARTLAAALTLCALLTATACSALTTPPTAEKPDLAATTPTPHPKSPAATPDLTQAQAQATLLTEVDLGEPWTPTQGAATWHDAVLKATTKKRDCQRLFDTLYSEELFGADARPRAVVGLDDDWNETQLRQQVVAHPAADVDRTLAWLKKLPKKCARFTVKTARGDLHDVEVGKAALPEVGDARQGLRVLVWGETADGEPAAFTLDVAVVRVGDDAIGLTHGGFGEVAPEVAQAVVQLGAQRLTEVRRKGRVEV